MSYGDWEEGKNKRAGHDGKGEERKGRRLPPFLFSHRPPRAFYFSIIAVLFSIFIGIQPENLRRRENRIRIRDLPITGVSLQLNYAARERLEDIKKIKPIYKDNALAFIFQEDCVTILTQQIISAIKISRYVGHSGRFKSSRKKYENYKFSTNKPKII